MPRDETDTTHAKTAAAIRTLGHPASGGHTQPSKSPMSKANRTNWDVPARDDYRGKPGGEMTEHREYPKHVTVDGVLHVVHDIHQEAHALGVKVGVLKGEPEHEEPLEPAQGAAEAPTPSHAAASAKAPHPAAKKKV
jgi:hypothetical protein